MGRIARLTARLMWPKRARGFVRLADLGDGEKGRRGLEGAVLAIAVARRKLHSSSLSLRMVSIAPWAAAF